MGRTECPAARTMGLYFGVLLCRTQFSIIPVFHHSTKREVQMQRQMIKIVGFMVVIGLALGSAVGYAQTPAAEFYKGKTITWIVSAEPGGATDVLTRILTPYVSRETGARVLVKNMTGGSMEGDNWVYNEAKKDGLTMLTEGTLPLLLSDLLKSPGVQYTTEKFNFLAGIDPTGTIFAVSPKFPHRTLEALRKFKGLKAGASTHRGYIAVAGSVMLHALGLDGKVVSGYQGMKSVTLAVSQGEMDVVVSSEKTLARETKQGNVVPLFIVGDERSPLLPDLPTMKEFGVAVPKELTEACKMLMADSWSVALPPGVPADRINALRNIFRKMVDLKDLQNDMIKWSGIWRPFIPGEKLQEHLVTIKNNKELAGQLESILKKYTAAK